MKPAPPQPHSARDGVRTLYRSPGTARVGKRNEAARARGEETAPVDCTPYTAHVLQLHSWGMTDCMIAAAAGCSNSAIGDIREGVYPVIRRLTAAAVMRVTPHPHPRQKLCLAIGAKRRVRALNALGWRNEDIAHELGLTLRDISQMLNPVRTRIRYARWVAIVELYERRSMTPGPSENTRRRAKAAGHAPPLAWEDRDIDHPLTEPDWVAVWGECKHGHLYSPENTKTNADGSRACRPCHRASNARAKASKLARTAA